MTALATPATTTDPICDACHRPFLPVHAGDTVCAECGICRHDSWESWMESCPDCGCSEGGERV